MSVLRKIWTALRGSARELGDAVVDANSIRIFEQEIRDAQAAIDDSKRALTGVMADKMKTDRRIAELDGQIADDEASAIKALDQNNEALALEVAQRIAKREAERAEQTAISTRLGSQIATLRQKIDAAEKIIADHQRELSIVRTTESVQKATVQIVDNIAAQDSTLSSARNSLERIKARQQRLDDRLAAGEVLARESGEQALDEKLKAAGIKGEAADANAILARLRGRNES